MQGPREGTYRAPRAGEAAGLDSKDFISPVHPLAWVSAQGEGAVWGPVKTLRFRCRSEGAAQPLPSVSLITCPQSCSDSAPVSPLCPQSHSASAFSPTKLQFSSHCLPSILFSVHPQSPSAPPSVSLVAMYLPSIPAVRILLQMLWGFSLQVLPDVCPGFWAPEEPLFFFNIVIVFWIISWT